MSDEEFDRKIQQLRNEGDDDFADAINGLRAEITAERQASKCDGLRKQFHTQAEQRDFVGKLVDNMPHARIAAEFEEFKAEVADALAALRKKVVALQLPVGHVEYSQYDYGVGDALNCVDTTIAKLGLAPKEKQ